MKKIELKLTEDKATICAYALKKLAYDATEDDAYRLTASDLYQIIKNKIGLLHWIPPKSNEDLEPIGIGVTRD